MIELRGTISQSDVIRFQYFHSLRRFWLLVIFIVVYIFFVVLWLFAFSADANNAVTNLSPLLIVMTLWIVATGVMPRYNGRRLMKKIQPYLNEPILYRFTDEGVMGESASTSYKMAWPLFKNVRETERLFLLYHMKNMAVIVPKSLFQNAPEMEEWRSFVRQHAPAHKIEKPGFVARRC